MKQCEKTWMLKLRTVYLYGLNDWLEDTYKKDDYDFVGDNFPPLPRKCNMISCYSSHKNNNPLSPGELIVKFKCPS